MPSHQPNLTDGPVVDDQVQQYYTWDFDESTRLSATLKGQLERARLYEFLTGWLPAAPSRIADVGGGTGTHAVWLQHQGYNVDLLDPVVEHITAARDSGVSAQLGDARRLPWPNETFDGVLMAGPLYHLPGPADRRLALREAARVTRPGGVVIGIAINRASSLIGSTLANTLVRRLNVVEPIVESGYSADNERVAHCYYHRESELRTEFTEAGLRPVDVFGLTGPGGWLAVLVDAHFKNQEYSGKLAAHDPLDTALAACRVADRMPELVAASSLFLAVGRKD